MAYCSGHRMRSAAEHPEIKMQSTRHEGMYQPPVGRAVVHTVRDAAEWLRCSPDAVRRAAKGAGVIRIRGNSVRGMVELTSGSRTGYLPYSI